MSALAAASLRHLLRHPAQLALALLGLTLGVGTMVAVDVATASAQRAFELSLQAVNGAATHQLSAAPEGIDEALYVRLRREGFTDAAAPLRMAPVVSGYVTVGDRVLQLLGIDPFASAALAGAGPGAARLPQGLEALRALLTEPGAVMLSAATARELNIGADGRFELSVGGVSQPAHLIARLSDDSPGLGGLMITDISQAQEWLAVQGHLSRIDLSVPDDAGGRAALARLMSRMPPGVELSTTRAQAQETLSLTDAFTTNLKAMSLLALLVGTFLIYGAVSFAVLQRRSTLAVLRALGATRGEVLRLVLAEALLLGIAGAACGLLLGALLGRALVGLVSQTINDLYFVVAVRTVSVPPLALLAAAAAGVATALLAALIPALEVSGSAPQLGLKRAVLERRARFAARRLLEVSALLGLLAALIVVFTQRSLAAGFAALLLLLLAVAAATPAALAALARLAARRAGERAVLRLALSDIAGSLSRTGVAVAALGMALAAMIGVAVMVQSFRESLRDWLHETLRADIYVSAPGVSESLERRLSPELLRTLVAVPGVRAHSEGRRVSVTGPKGTLELNAVSLAPDSLPGYRFTQGSAESAWPQFAHGAVLISEPLAWRLALAPGEALSLLTPGGPHAFRIAGVYREYGNDHGEVLMDRGEYRRWWHDEGVAALGLFLASGVPVAQVMDELRARAQHHQALLIRSNAELRELSMRIFERTFLITRVLYWLAGGVAAVGLISALLAWELERAPQLALLRALGLTPRGSAALLVAQTLFMGLAALTAAIPAGVLTALVLTAVINRRAFGWQIALHLTAAQFLSALVLALAAALVAALYPAWRSARLAPAAGLRAE
jgi:putative ABC transport system permease protein